MAPRHTLATSLVLAAALGCGADLGTGPVTEFDGIRYTARIEDIISVPSLSRQFTVIVTLTNTTSEHRTRTYRALCPVRLRLYRTGDDTRVYDETARPCAETPVAEIAIDGKSTATLQSGPRFPSVVAGDSLPIGSATYRIRVVVTTERGNSALIDAGTTTLHTHAN